MNNQSRRFSILSGAQDDLADLKIKRRDLASAHPKTK